MNKFRSWTALLIAALVVCTVMGTMFRYDVGPKGIVLPYSDHRSMGAVSVMYHTANDTVFEQELVEAKARALALEAGAHNLLILQSGHTYPGIPAALAVMVLRAAVLH